MLRAGATLTHLMCVTTFLATLAASSADARRGGSFGSRGSRTYYAPRSSGLSSGYVGPVQRSMTRPSSAPSYPGYGQPAPMRSRGGWGGFGGGVLGGLLAGGLIGGLMGHGFGGGGGWGGSGGGGGFLSVIFQLAIVGGLIWLGMRFFRRRTLAAGPQMAQASFLGGGFGSTAYSPAPQPQGFAPNAAQTVDILITQTDRASFERLLIDIQDAFGHEDYARLREQTTPEVMSYLAEELSQNATQGRRNEVSGTRLLQSDVSEAWNEGATDYATVALKYESVDIMRDRNTGAIVQGDPAQATVTTEVWTFNRDNGGPWKLSAIQET